MAPLIKQIEQFDKADGAEILMRAGSLWGFHGQMEHIGNSQERSAELLGKARRMFIDLLDFEKVAECENYLALSFSRLGGHRESEVWVEESLSRKIPEMTDARIHAYLIKGMILKDRKKYSEAVKYFQSVKEKFWEFGDFYLLGSFCTNIGICYRNLNKLGDTLKFYKLAGEFHQKSGHLSYLGTIRNNLAYVYKLFDEMENAHASVDEAINIYDQIKDISRLGSSLDTKAFLYVTEEKFDKALESVDESLTILKTGDNADFLLDSYLTKFEILLKLDRRTDAFLCLSQGTELANTKIGEDRGRKFIENCEKILDGQNTSVVKNVRLEKEFDDREIELVFPPELSSFEEIECIRIKNTHLERYGLTKNSLAIVGKTEIQRGDLVAVVERETNEVSCGIYDYDFGIICLTGDDSEPMLFDEIDIQLLGKIIGVADGDEDDKIHVKPIDR